MLEIVTNKATKRVRSLGEYKDVVIRQPQVKVTEDNAEVLMLLDLVIFSSLSPREILDFKNLLDLAKRTSRSDVREIISCECSR